MRLTLAVRYVLHEEDNLETLKAEHRRGFGIECSYRLMRRLRASTTSRNPVLRFFLSSVDLILANVWVYLRWKFKRRLARRPRRIDEHRFRLHRFSRFLVCTIKNL